MADKGWPNPTDYKDNEKLILDYTYQRGRVDAIKEIVNFVKQQVHVKDTIDKKLAEKEAYR